MSDWGWNFWRVVGVAMSVMGCVAFFLPHVELRDAILMYTAGVALESRGRTEFLLSKKDSHDG